MHCSELMDFDRNSITVLKEIVHLVRCAKIAITIPLPSAWYFHDLSVSVEITSVSDCFHCIHSSGSSGLVGGGGEKHEIYAAEFSGHLFCDLFLQGRGGGGGRGPWPPRPPGSATDSFEEHVCPPLLTIQTVLPSFLLVQYIRYKID